MDRPKISMSVGASKPRIMARPLKRMPAAGTF